MKTVKAIKNQHYNKYTRDPESARFYKSALWLKTKELKLNRDPLCETCLQAGRTVVAQMVHHLIPVKKGTKNLDLNFLVSLCHACHNQIESEIEKERNQ